MDMEQSNNKQTREIRRQSETGGIEGYWRSWRSWNRIRGEGWNGT